MRYFSLIALALLVNFACSCSENPTEEEHTPQLQIGTLPPRHNQVPPTHTFRHQFSLINADSANTYVWQVWAVGQLPTGVFGINQLGSFEFTPESADSGNTYDFRVRVLLEHKEQDVHEFSVEATGIKPIILRLVQTDQLLLPGSRAEVSVIKVSGDIDFGSLQLSLTYDPQVMTPMIVDLGSEPTDCDWEYLTYRSFENGEHCDSLCEAMIMITALSDANNGPDHPECTFVQDGSELIQIIFQTANDSTLECTSTPLQFIWRDCSTNSIHSSRDYFDTLTVGSTVMNCEWDGSYPLDQYRVQRSDCDSTYTSSLSGWCDRYRSDCRASEIVDRIIFWNTNVQFLCD